MLRVLKFGGTSVEDARAIRRVIEIIQGKVDQKLVVVLSAMSDVTNALLEISCIAGKKQADEALLKIEELRKRHLSVIKQLQLSNITTQILELFMELETIVNAVATLGRLDLQTRDRIVSFGEHFSCLIVSSALEEHGVPTEFVDARQFMFTSDNFAEAVPEMDLIKQAAHASLMPVLNIGLVAVTQGFVGVTSQGETATLGRGGSDYSAAIIGAVLGADAIEIWTDVDGIMTADPRVVSAARRIPAISYMEAAELAYFGAKVLHPKTIQPAVERGIPVYIFNTKNPSCKGTLITQDGGPSSNNLVMGITRKENVTSITIRSSRMLLSHGFLRTLFEVFDRHKTSVDVVTTSEVCVSLTLDNAENLELILADLESIGQVEVNTRAVICVIGRNLRSQPGVVGKILSTIPDIVTHMVSFGSSEINLTFQVDCEKAREVIQRLHSAFLA